MKRAVLLALVMAVLGVGTLTADHRWRGTRRGHGLPPGLAKRGGDLPPGLRRHMERTGHLPASTSAGRWPAAVAAKGASLDVAGQRPALVWAPGSLRRGVFVDRDHDGLDDRDEHREFHRRHGIRDRRHN